MDSPILNRVAVAIIAFLVATAVVLALLRIRATKSRIEAYIAKNGFGAAVRTVILIGFFAIGSILTILLS